MRKCIWSLQWTHLLHVNESSKWVISFCRLALWLHVVLYFWPPLLQMPCKTFLYFSSLTFNFSVLLRSGSRNQILLIIPMWLPVAQWKCSNLYSPSRSMSMTRDAGNKKAITIKCANFLTELCIWCGRRTNCGFRKGGVFDSD